MIIHATDDDHLECIIKDNDSLVIVFGASWCGPCKRAKPVYENLPGCIVYADYTELESTAMAMNITKIPHFVSIHNGAEVSRMQSSAEADILKFFEEHEST